MKDVILFAVMMTLFAVATFVAIISPQKPIQFHDLLFAIALIIGCIGIASCKDK